MRSIIRFVMLVSLACLAACDVFVSHHDVARLTSPSGAIDAVVVETNGGATTSFGYEVYVVPKGHSVSDGIEVAYLYGAARNKQAYGVNLHWKSANSLEVEYLSAQSITLKKSTASIAGHTISTTLVSGVFDPMAPPGGMYYNLQKKNHTRR